MLASNVLRNALDETKAATFSFTYEFSDFEAPAIGFVTLLAALSILTLKASQSLSSGQHSRSIMATN